MKTVPRSADRRYAARIASRPEIADPASMTDHLPAPTPPTTRLADRLWSRTGALHREAERSGVFQDLLRGRAGRPAYALLLRNLLPVYEALEHGLDTSVTLASLAWPELYRARPLRADLERLGGMALPLLPAASRYAGRIRETGHNDGGLLLIAHAYVRYLGDLNGGQILKRLLGKHLGLTPDSLSFYDFPDDPLRLALDYRAAIDTAGDAIDKADAAVLDEACLAFRLNIDLSEEVQHEARRRGAADLRAASALHERG